MSGSLERVRLVTGKLLRQNRVLIGFLLLWPCVLSGVVLAADRRSLALEDVSAIMQQLLLYGLVMVGLCASVALGTEQRARRIHQVLGRAVGRAEYLLSLGASVFLPFVGYLLVWIANAGMFAALLHVPAPTVFAAAFAEFACGLLLCAAGLLFSILLPQTLAAIANGIVFAALTLAGMYGVGGIAKLFPIAIGGPTPLENTLWFGTGEAFLAAGALAGAAALLFVRKDVRQLS